MTTRWMLLVCLSLAASLACSDDPLSLGSNEEVVLTPSCPAGDIIATTPEQLYALTGCPVIDGSLTITGTPGDGLRLLQLARLERVTGSLHIQGVDELDGLNALEQVGSLSLVNVGELSLNALGSLSLVDRDISISECPNLISLSGLEQLRSWEELRLWSLPQLTSLGGMPGPPRVAGIYLRDVPALKDMDLPFVREADEISITQTAIERLLRFPLTRVETLTIEENPVLESLDALSELASIGRLSIRFNPALQRVGLAGLQEVHSVHITNNDSLKEVPLYQTFALQTVTIGLASTVRLSEESFSVNNNAQLTRITLPDTFANVQRVAVFDNPRLATLDLNELAKADGLLIMRNPGLSQVLANQLTRVEDLEVVDNPELSMAPFASVMTFTSRIRGNREGAPAP